MFSESMVWLGFKLFGCLSVLWCLFVYPVGRGGHTLIGRGLLLCSLVCWFVGIFVYVLWRLLVFTSVCLSGWSVWTHTLVLMGPGSIQTKNSSQANKNHKHAGIVILWKYIRDIKKNKKDLEDDEWKRKDSDRAAILPCNSIRTIVDIGPREKKD